MRKTQQSKEKSEHLKEPRIGIGMPKQLHVRMKIIAMQRSVSFTDMYVQAVERFLAQEKSQ